jgi:hypothetical protein
MLTTPDVWIPSAHAAAHRGTITRPASPYLADLVSLTTA